MKKLLILTAALAAASPAPAQSDADFARQLGAIRPAAFAAAQAAEPAQAGAAPVAGGRVVSDRTTDVSVDLDEATVKCSAADYSGPMLKVLVPGLADLTLLNHRNTREGAPCIAAGRCSETLGPSAILADGNGSVTVPVRVVLSKETRVDGDKCHVTLVETVTTEIRGVPFFHQRRQPMPDRAAADCR